MSESIVSSTEEAEAIDALLPDLMRMFNDLPHEKRVEWAPHLSTLNAAYRQRSAEANQVADLMAGSRAMTTSLPSDLQSGESYRRPLIGSVQWRDALPLDRGALACRLNVVWMEATKHEPGEQRWLVAHSRQAMAANGIDPDADRPLVAADDPARVAVLAKRLRALLLNGKDTPYGDEETRRFYESVIRALLVSDPVDEAEALV